VSETGIFDVLNQLGLSYDRRTSARGVPYAGFQLIGSPESGDVRVTVLLEHDVLRVTSHDIASPTDAAAMIEAGAALPLGAAYRSPEDGAAELSIAVFVGDGAQPGRDLVSGLLDYAVAATGALSHGAPPPRRPRLPGRVSVEEMRAALAAYGHPVSAVNGGVRLEVPLPDGLRCGIAFHDEGDGWVAASAGYVPERRVPRDEHTVGALQQLQRWAAAGRFVLDRASALRVHVPTPLAGGTHTRAVVWTASQCAALLQTAPRHLRLTP
jgi:hypothetical protein